jgi:hypothetical protein
MQSVRFEGTDSATPESLENTDFLDFTADIKEKVIFPTWAEENHCFSVEISLKKLNESQELALVDRLDFQVQGNRPSCS